MKKFRDLFIYIIIIGSFTAFICGIIHFGEELEIGRNILPKISNNSAFQNFVDSVYGNIHHSIGLLLLQMIIIIVVARIFGWLFKKIGQPSVIGEILAGIVLGPSLLGTYFPDLSLNLFPKASLVNLNILSQIGLILFMFVVGMDLDLKVLRSKIHEAVVISHASIIIPFTLGVGLAFFIYQGHAPANVEFSPFALFIGISISITAFPVLARIVQERGINKTRLGAIVITCAAADDITAWCLLAVVIAIVKAGSFLSALYTIFFAVSFVFVMSKFLKPILKKMWNMSLRNKNKNKQVVVLVFLILLVSAFTTEIIGIHALFGAFMAGVVMPDDISFRRLFVEKIEDIAQFVFLPLFFVISGLKTEIGLLNDWASWEITGTIILIAIIGKFVGSALTAKLVGQNWHDSIVIGALMNTRGLMELVALNIGYDMGCIGPEMFAMMVIMALVTTFMTGPSLNLARRLFKRSEADII